MRSRYVATAVAALVLAGAGAAACLAQTSPRVARVPFEVRLKGLSTSLAELGVYLLPGDRLDLELRSGAPGGRFQVAPGRGSVEPHTGTRFTFVAPDEVGLCQVDVTEEVSGTTMRLNVFVMVPASKVCDGLLGGYRIGTYPEPLRTARADRTPPRGFVEVTEENQFTPIGPHFSLRQVLCKQGGGFPKYVVIEERLVLLLERLLDRLRELGHPATTLEFISGYRTPFYNESIGNVSGSRHQWGDAADVYVDARPRDGIIDDINGDDRSDIGDAHALYDIIDCLDGPRDSFQGGLGLYGQTSTHPPFVHVDMRGHRARWTE